MSTTSAVKSKRVSRKDWCLAGLSVLRDQGYQALTIERICLLLEKTKGSFYHHFVDLEAYLAALLQQWEADLTEQPIAVSSREASLPGKAARLDDVVLGLDHRLDRAVRAWALHDARAREAVSRVDERRLEYVAQLHRAAKHRNPRVLAEIEYAAFVGLQHLDFMDDRRRAEKVNEALREALALLVAHRSG
ncbi:Transcriptional regulator, TetR family [Labilithrix luteola]|uniref:Transcriptional regulator, TetR family n=1 Tax=Labilithrix luteola TaxID=1391654 RepID=A0A0K1PPT2_9BACT|nr:TetR/AcrR family transcriptional regulator [Labilithrix luteola]AKU95129.1 Transcriptional regulator, TetR family [Labilithrix luteola]